MKDIVRDGVDDNSFILVSQQRAYEMDSQDVSKTSISRGLSSLQQVHTEAISVVLNIVEWKPIVSLGRENFHVNFSSFRGTKCVTPVWKIVSSQLLFLDFQS